MILTSNQSFSLIGANVRIQWYLDVESCSHIQRPQCGKPSFSSESHSAFLTVEDSIIISVTGNIGFLLTSSLHLQKVISAKRYMQLSCRIPSYYLFVMIQFACLRKFVFICLSIGACLRSCTGRQSRSRWVMAGLWEPEMSEAQCIRAISNDLGVHNRNSVKHGLAKFYKMYSWRMDYVPQSFGGVILEVLLQWILIQTWTYDSQLAKARSTPTWFQQYVYKT